MRTKSLAPMTQRSLGPGSILCSTLHGNCIPIVECSLLLPRNTARNISFSQISFDNPLSESMHLNIAARVLPTRSEIPSCFSVFPASVISKEAYLLTFRRKFNSECHTCMPSFLTARYFYIVDLLQTRPFFFTQSEKQLL